MLSLEFAVCSAVATLRAQGMTASALELATLSLQDDTDQGRLWELKGLLHSDQGETDDARKSLETANSLVPLHSEGRFVLAECYALQGQVDLARDLFCLLVDWPETPTELLLRIAAHFDRMGRSDLSVQACRKASVRDAGYARPYYEMAYYMRRCQYPTHLVESMARRAVHLDPDAVSYRIGLAVILHSLDRLQDAYDAVSEISPRQLQRNACQCCLTRLVDVYEFAGDRARSAICRTRLQEMAAIFGPLPESEPERLTPTMHWTNRFELGRESRP